MTVPVHHDHQIENEKQETPRDSKTTECKILWVSCDHVNFDFTCDDASVAGGLLTNS
jgi:hypothetical protein